MSNVRYCNTVNVETNELDADLKRAQLVKIYSEAMIAIVTVIIYAQFLVKSDAKDRWKAKLRQWRIEFFGRPPLTEEQIQHAAHQLNIEAARVLRSVDES